MTIHVPLQLLPGFLAGTGRIGDVPCDFRIAVERPEIVQILDDLMA